MSPLSSIQVRLMLRDSRCWNSLEDETYTVIQHRLQALLALGGLRVRLVAVSDRLEGAPFFLDLAEQPISSELVPKEWAAKLYSLGPG